MNNDEHEIHCTLYANNFINFIKYKIARNTNSHNYTCRDLNFTYSD